MDRIQSLQYELDCFIKTKAMDDHFKKQKITKNLSEIKDLLILLKEVNNTVIDGITTLINEELKNY